MPDPSNAALRRLPSVDRVLAELSGGGAIPYSDTYVVEAVRAEIDARRQRLIGGAPAAEIDAIVDLSAVAEAAEERLAVRFGRSLRPVINATGVVVHTNLGRAPVSTAAAQAMAEAAGAYNNLEFDLEAGQRGSRADHLRELLRSVTGAEDGVAVNNNAAALYLAVSAHAAGKQVVVSRGQAVEIGGGFRIPDIVRQSGAELVEVGTTNRTRPADYAGALDQHDRVAALLRVHSSNFRIIGFTEETSTSELRMVIDAYRGQPGRAAQGDAAVALGLRPPPNGAGPLLIDDVGSGCLLDSRGYGMAYEPTPQESIADGRGPGPFLRRQAVGRPPGGESSVGKASALSELRRHPLMRVLRPDKTAIAGLAATLEHYIAGQAERQIPVWRMIAASADDLRARAESWRAALDVGVVERGESPIGGGSLPGETRPTWLLALDDACLSVSAADAAAALRQRRTAVVARLLDGRLLLDPRTVFADQEDDLLTALRAVVAPAESLS